MRWWTSSNVGDLDLVLVGTGGWDFSSIIDSVRDADPSDVAGFCAALLSLYGSAERRAEYSVRALERAERFSWQRCASDTLAAYRTALGR
jgi:glycosyltransferase involved in cell wall biosynthesis